MERFKIYETIVIDAQYFTKRDIELLHQNGTVVYTYLNIGSIENFREYYTTYAELAIGEYVTDIRYEFGTVPAGFRMTEKATVYVYVPPYMANGYNITNRVDCGGSYQGEWDSSTSAWVTKIHRAPIYTKPTLPKTGY